MWGEIHDTYYYDKNPRQNQKKNKRLWCGTCVALPSKAKAQLYQVSPTIGKDTQCWADPFGFQDQCIHHWGVLLWLHLSLTLRSSRRLTLDHSLYGKDRWKLSFSQAPSGSSCPWVTGYEKDYSVSSGHCCRGELDCKEVLSGGDSLLCPLALHCLMLRSLGHTPNLVKMINSSDPSGMKMDSALPNKIPNL